MLFKEGLLLICCSATCVLDTNYLIYNNISCVFFQFLHRKASETAITNNKYSSLSINKALRFNAFISVIK